MSSSETNSSKVDDREREKVAIVMLTDRWIPKFITSLADPFITLRYVVDTRKLLKDSAAQFSNFDDVEINTTNKKGSLKRILSKKTIISASTSSADPNNNLSKDSVEREMASNENIINEAGRVCKALSTAVDAFVNIVITACDIEGDKLVPQIADSLSFVAPYALLDTTITHHAQLIKLKLPDNRLYFEIGKALMYAHVLAVTAAHGYTIDGATKRTKRINDQTISWLTETFGDKKVRGALPIVWLLHQETHLPLQPNEVEQRTIEVMKQFPCILIGVLHVMCLTTYRDVILEKLMKYTF